MWDLQNFFVDYLQLTDENEGRWPETYGVVSYAYDVSDPQNPKELSTKYDRLPITKSSDAKMYLKITPTMLFIKGNPSKFGRTDNLFGYSYEECLDIINNILHSKGLAPLHAPKITTIDLTLNVRCGSEEKLNTFIRTARKAQLPRMTTRNMGEGVQFINKSAYLKIYQKHLELRHLNNPKAGTQEHRHETFHYVESLAQYCQDNGVARVELRLHSRWLKNRQIRDAYAESTDTWKSIYREFEKLIPHKCGDSTVEKFSRMEFLTYLEWREGFNPRAKCTRQTFYKYRHAILEKTNGVIDIGNDTVTLDMREKLDSFITEALPIPADYVREEIEREYEE